MKLIFLGTAQDGGIPQAGCSCDNCVSFNRSAASLALVEGDQAILIDCTPDFRRQYKFLLDRYQAELSSIYLTHAHWGHYGGLPLLGKEALNSDRLPLYISERFHRFFKENEPFSSLFTNGNLSPQIIKPEQTTVHEITPVPVPHRDEFSDTFAFLINLNDRCVLYMPDIDSFNPVIRKLIRAVDLAIIDATFYNDGELPGRDISKISHPRVEETIREFKDISDRIIFTHLNHSNPLVNVESRERQLVELNGFKVADDGDEINN